MANPLYGQNKSDNAIDEAANDRKQIYRFATPPVVNDYAHTANALADGTAADTVLHAYALWYTLYLQASVQRKVQEPLN